MVKEMTLKEHIVIRQFPPKDEIKEILNVGCGGGRIDFHLLKKGYKVISTDYQSHVGWVRDFFMREMEDWKDLLDYHGNCNIFDIGTFPIQKADIVLCSEVLEHLSDYKEAFANLLKLTKNILVITVPFRRSFNVPGPPPRGHCNYWSDKTEEGFKDIKEFVEMAKPYKVTIEKGITKKIDFKGRQRIYTIKIEKNVKNTGKVSINDISKIQMNW